MFNCEKCGTTAEQMQNCATCNEQMTEKKLVESTETAETATETETATPEVQPSSEVSGEQTQ